MSECPDNLRVRCLLCCQILECKRADTTALLFHIRDVHPEVTLQSSDELQSVTGKPSHVASKGSQKKDIKPLEDEVLSKIRSPEDEVKQTVRPVDIPGYGVNRTKLENERKTSSVQQRPTGSNSRPSNTHAGETTETKVLYKREYKFKEPFSPNRSGKRKLYKTSIEKWRPGRSTIVCPECGANKRPMIKSQTDKVSHSPFGAAFILTCWPFCFLPCLFPPPTKEYLHCAVCNHFLGIYDRKTEVINPNERSLQKTPGRTSSNDSIRLERKL